MFVPMTGIYEPSAIQQLPDGRFLVAEDEKAQPLSVVSLRSDGTCVSRPLDAEAGGLPKLDDLEGLTIDAAGQLYAITSHSRSKDGEERKSRHRLVRFRIEGERIVAPAVTTGWKPALVAAHPLLARAAAVLDVKGEGGLNIEALEMAPDGRQLLVGFRSPLADGRALLVGVENMAEVFDAGAEPRLAPEIVSLDLGGHGLRCLAWIPALNGYLASSGPVAREQVHFGLWFWSGQPGESPRPASVPDLPGFEHAEGVTAATIDGKPMIVIVSDDGSRDEGRPARFLLLDPARLRIAG